MKILKLEFRNINSLKGPHEIDFNSAPFTGSSLFAITGPTGSGKSTILDVISLALFNKIPRLDKVSKAEIIKTGAIITRNQQEAMAAVTYEGKEGSYRSEWSISTARTGSLREYTMQLSHAESGELLPLKKSEVPEKNEELIGLNYNQFIKSVLLAQGEFAQFLKARKEERGELLEKITGTGIYRQLGRMAWERHKLANVEIIQQQQAISLLLPKLLEEEKKKGVTASLQEKESLCKPLEEAMERLKKQLELKDSIARSTAEIAKLELEKGKAQTSLEAFNKENGKPLELHEKLRPYSEELRQWSHLREEIATLNKEQELRRSEEEQNLLELQNCLKATGEFTKAEISAENIFRKLQEFREKVAGLEDLRRQKLEIHNNLKSKLEASLAEVKLNWQQDPEERLQLLEEMHLASESKLGQYKEQLQLDLEDLPGEKQQLRSRLEASRKAQLEWIRLEQLSAEIVRLKTEATGIKTQAEKLPSEKVKLLLQVESSRSRLESLQLKKENRLLVASNEELRRKLESGKPCFVCGSLEHPYAVELPELEDSFDSEIKLASEEWKQLSHQLSSVTTSLESFERRLREISAIVQQKEEEQKHMNSSFSSRYNQLKKKEDENWEQLCSRLENHLLELEACEKEQRLFIALTGGIPLHRELNQVLQEGKKLKLQLDELYIGKNIHSDCQELQNNWFRFSQHQENLQKLQQELGVKIGKKSASFEEVTAQLEPVGGLGFDSILSARMALLPEPQYQQLHSQRDQLNSRLSAQLTSIKLLQSQLEDLRANDTEESREELQEGLRTRDLQLRTVKQDCEDLRRILRNDADTQKEVQDIRASIAAQEKKIRRWRLLNELIGDSMGKKFNDFAQDLSLSQLIHLANLRLRDLSDRYRIDKPRDEEDDGLVAIDEHMGGQRRSVKTLSGGETFLLSLSMALALSDLASKNVEINSLFIDEGFGTLDPETLDQTLDTLEKLQAESSKTIGIISHVDSLKERIATQVQLKRNGQGYSQLEVKV